MSYTFKSGDTPGNVAITLGGKWADWVNNYYKLPDGTVKKGSEIDPTKIPIGTVALTPAEYDDSDGGGDGTSTGPAFDADADIGDAPTEFNGTTIASGGRLVAIKNPEGSDSKYLWYVVYEWNGIEMAYEVGTVEDFKDVFGTGDASSLGLDISIVTQSAFDETGFVLAGDVGEVLGVDESLQSLLEREQQALGLEDLPDWLANSKDALFLVATATADEWSSGRLWQELSTTEAFQTRFGGALDIYLQGNVTISDAVNQLVADEDALRAALRPYLPTGNTFQQFGNTADGFTSTDYLQGLLTNGWTPGSVAQVLEQAEVLRSDPTSLIQANAILAASGLGSIDEVDFLNALSGFGDNDVVEALNTAAAGAALVEAGLDDVDLDLLMQVVDTSDRILTVESFQQLAQQLAFNSIRFGEELGNEKLGFNRDDLIAAAFGEGNPNGKTPGEVINALARFERDRQAAGSGFDQSTGFQDEKGRLRIAGLGGL